MRKWLLLTLMVLCAVVVEFFRRRPDPRDELIRDLVRDLEKEAANRRDLALESAEV